MANSRGQPTKYKKEYCQKLVDFMAQGYSFEAFAGHVSVDRDTIYEWANVHKEFSDAKKEAFSKSREFWEQIALKNLHLPHQGGSFNATVWIFNMKNRFGWKDNIELKQTDDKEKFKSESDLEKLDTNQLTEEYKKFIK